jgi:polyhydroxyalkanoate synthesis regulator phasin
VSSAGAFVDDLRTVLQDSWTKALLAASSVEEQAQALVGRVGHLLDPASGPEAARQLVAEVTARLKAQRQDFQTHLQHAVKAALDHVRLPNRAELETLQSRLAQLEARLSSVEDERAGRGGRPSA